MCVCVCVRARVCALRLQRPARDVSFAGRYRIQSGSLEALWLVSSELVRRLNEHFAASEKPSRSAAGGGKEAEEPFTILYQEPLPLADFFGCIDDHFEVRAGCVAAKFEECSVFVHWFVYHRVPKFFTLWLKSMCMRSKAWLAASVWLRLARLPTTARHACGCARPSRARLCHRNSKLLSDGSKT